MTLIIALVVVLASCRIQPTVEVAAAPADENTNETESVPDGNTNSVDLSEANPFDPTQSYVWQFAFSENQLAILAATGDYSWYGVDTHIYAYADTLAVLTLDEQYSITFEKPEVALGGEMNRCTLPCKTQLVVDTNENVDGQEMGSYDNIKFGNLLYGGPYAEYFLYNYYFPAIGVTSPMAAYGWMEPSYLGYLPLDYLVMEMTKDDMLDRVYGEGNWLMAYEGSGDIGSGSANYPSCQAGDCDDTVLDELSADLTTAIDEGSVINFLDRRYMGGHEKFFAFCAGEKMVGQWDGYCDAIHNYTMVIVVNEANPDEPLFDLIPHSLDLTLNPMWDYSWYGLFGGSMLMQGCYLSSDGCGDEYVDYVEMRNEEWLENVEVFEATLDGQAAYLEAIGMNYDDYPKWLADNKTFIQGRYDTIANMIAYYRDPCSQPDTGWYYMRGGGGGDTGTDQDSGSDTATDTGTDSGR